MSDETLLHMIATQEEAITDLNQSIRARDDLMRAAIKEVDELRNILSSTFLRMLAARMERVK